MTKHSNVLNLVVTEAQPKMIANGQYEFARCPKHFVTGAELTTHDMEFLLKTALQLKQERANSVLRKELSGKHLALIFDKQSLRTRFSFMVAMRELGGDVIESDADTRKSETPEDHAQVLGGYCHAIMIRTHEDEILEKMVSVAKVPIINGLTDDHHPCQILADLLTLLEVFGKLQGLTLTYIGDGNNILHSLLLLAPLAGVTVHYCCPPSRQPKAEILASALHAHADKIKSFTTPADAVHGADAVYTDVWTSMGFEAQRADHIFEGYQVNEAMMAQAKPNAVFMHCLPMERGKEVSLTLPTQSCSVIYQQSENRLHVQKAILLYVFNMIKGI